MMKIIKHISPTYPLVPTVFIGSRLSGWIVSVLKDTISNLTKIQPNE